MKSLLTILLLTLISASSWGQTWRSKYYPTNWTPPVDANFYTDAFLQDYSYAGYKCGEKVPQILSSKIYDVTKAPFTADNTGKVDATAAIQKAIDAAKSNGGGVVYLPAGTYKVNPGANGEALNISGSNIYLKGDGVGKTFILNTSYKMNKKDIIKVGGGDSWLSNPSSSALLTADVMGPVTVIPVNNPTMFQKGDLILIRNFVGDPWITEHKVTTWLGKGSSLKGLIFCRYVTNVDPVKKTITIDVPLRYALKTRDGACAFKINGMVSEVGLMDFSIGNVQNPSQSGYAEDDYQVSGTAGFDSHSSYAINFYSTVNCWMKNISSYKPAGNTTGTHILSNGILVQYSKNVTIDNCTMSYAQYGGGGGNGYAFRSSANEVLMTNCTASFVRHGLVFSSMWASGNVLHKCNDVNTKFQCGNTGKMSTSGYGSDHHMFMSQSNLIDDCFTQNSGFFAYYRPFGGAVQHAVTSTHTAYWNIQSAGSKSICVWSQQARYGYVIGTSGAGSGVNTSENAPGTASITAPVDIVEGPGNGKSLFPQSLYLDQLSKRTGGGTPVNVAPTVSVSTSSSSATAPASVTLSATAKDADGTIANVDFYNGTTFLYSDATFPYSYSWSELAAGTYSITAKAYDDKGAITTSTAVSIVVTNPTPVNVAPTVSVSTSSSSATAPASVTLSATAKDADGTIANVDFYNGTKFLYRDATFPYSYSWSGLAAGTYSVTAKAYDNKGAVTTSTVVSIVVKTAPVTTTGINGLNCVATETPTKYTVVPVSTGATKINWWSNSAATVSVNPNNSKEATFTFPSSMNGSSTTISAGVNFSGSPYFIEYKYVVKIGGGCVVSRTGFVDINDTSVPTLNVYPNPTNSVLVVELNNDTNSDSIVSIINSVGEEVLRQDTQNLNQINFDLSSLKNGVYYVKYNSIVTRILVIR